MSGTDTERAWGKKVRAFLSANHMEPDVAIESFVLDSAVQRIG
ncbi:MAG: hypothetical protein ACYDHN_09965 [Solirubrobacteraceae bacterium]